MSNSRDDRYYAKAGKSPSHGDQAPGFFQTGQGGRTVLPPIYSAFPISHFPASGPYPNQYTQPRSIPTRYDYSNHALYNQWPNPSSSTPMNYGYYDTTDNRHASQDYYSTYPSSRASSAAPEHSGNSRKLPPLNTTPSTGRDDRWTSSSTASYSLGPADVPSSSGIRSPTASYPPSFAGYPSSANSPPNYGYTIPMTQSQLHSANNASMIGDTHRSSSPSHGPQIPPSYTPPPISPTTGNVRNEPTIKKKRKRADPNQLRVLNETYARTAFPSTEERQQLAKLLDMSARSVQIWFQNKRQSMRQTRQTSASSGSTLHHSFGLSDEEHGHSTGRYEITSVPHNPAYVPRSSQDTHYSPALSPTIPQRHPRSSQDAVIDTTGRQWPRY
ncbi:hypothetical protein BDP27DRAFT_1264067 [Rhodocollybia butyracea]|uniref:Homeobox domain-containing protein n=1 Tax=Rhodocollybia butyracea TaxID=206335 RepID=A0A9P5PXU0_9AGAR|nr:hypothetical protein BDP27DRAFT_1264067 [Rhodocollybia butyracea]